MYLIKTTSFFGLNHRKIEANSTIIGNPIPPRSGAFEVKINNILVFSKLSKNQFPTKNEIISWFE